MAIERSEVDLRGIRDPQKPVALVVGVVLVLVGVAGLTGLLDVSLGDGPALVLGLFGVPFWLGVTAVVAGLLGVVLSTYPGAGTTFNKLAAGLVLPIVFLLAVVDWLLAVGGLPALVLGGVVLVVAVVLVGVGVLLLRRHPVAAVLPVVAVVTLADWALGITAMTPSLRVNVSTLGLLFVLEGVLAAVAFEGGARRT